MVGIIAVLTNLPKCAADELLSKPDISRCINRWLVIGPFSNADYSAFDTDLIDEARCKPSLDQLVNDRRWVAFDDRLYCRNYDDYCDLYTFFHPKRTGAPPGGNEWVVAYAHTYVWSPEAKSVQLRVGSNDGFRAWVNGNLVASVKGQFRQAARDQDIVPIQLVAGWNRLLLKLANAYGVWGFYARLSDQDGKKLEGLEYATLPPESDLQIVTATLPTGYTDWPYVWLTLEIPPAEQKNTLAEIEQNTPSASPWRFEATGGTPPYEWKVIEGELPSGLVLESTEGELLGKCDRKQMAKFSIEVTDANKKTAQRQMSIDVLDRPNLWHETARLGALIHNSTSPEGKGWLGDPERQAALMSLAGYSYAAPMSKNNGGLAYWPTKVKNSARLPTGAGWEGLAEKDPLGSLATALRKRGIKVGYYYPLIESENNGLGGDDFAKNFPRYMDVRLAQIEELCLDYHPAVMWLDGANTIFTSYLEKDGRTNHEFDALYSLIKTFEPDCLVMANSGGECEYGMGDIDALVCESEGSETLDWYWGRWPEGQKGYSPKKLSVETWRFPNNGDSFLSDDEFFQWKEWLRVMVSMASEGYMCNLDHTGHKERFTDTARLQMAEWMHSRMHTLDGTKPGPLRDDVWGYDVIKGNTIYLHILQNERGKYGFRGKSARGLYGPLKSIMSERGYAPTIHDKLKVGPIDSEVARVWQEPFDLPLPFTVEGQSLTIDMRRVVVDEIDTIIAIELEPSRDAAALTTQGGGPKGENSRGKVKSGQSIRSAVHSLPSGSAKQSVFVAEKRLDTVEAQKSESDREPEVGGQVEWDAARAVAEWPDQRGVWAPVSWSEHPNKFNVFYDGTVTASAYGAYGFNKRANPVDRLQGLTLRVKLSSGATVSAQSASADVRRSRNPDGMHRSWWTSDTAPTFVVEHSVPAVLVEQIQFAHIPSGKEIQSGNEPHFLWVRFKVVDVLDVINDSKQLTCVITPQNDHLTSNMAAFNNVIQFNKPPFYPLPLDWEESAAQSALGYLRNHNVLFGNRNRLALPRHPNDEIKVSWHPIKEYLQDNMLYAKQSTEFEHLMVSMPCKPGAYFDLLVPFSQVDDDTINRELELGYDKALAEANEFWNQQLRTTTKLSCPEPLVQGHLDYFAPLTLMISERFPRKDEHLLISGSFSYEATWPTPMAIQCVALDLLGYGDLVANFLEPYRKSQGTIKPPSRYLSAHPGYFGNPRYLTSLDWITDHGAILYAAANHALLTGDEKFISRWLEPIIKGCEWIEQTRNLTGHAGATGILPAGVANDALLEEQQVWNDAWTYKGLTTSALLLRRLRHERAAEVEQWAANYRSRFQELLRDAVAKAPTWKNANNQEVPFIPPSMGETIASSAKHAFYLDTGPLVLVWSGLMEATDPIMDACRQWFRGGPQWRHFRRYSSAFQVPLLDREVSSCEPVYSWNIYHSLALGDHKRFAMGLYGLLAAGASQTSFVSSETRDGVFGNVFSTSAFIPLMVASAIETRGDDIHLLRMLPLGFMRSGGFRWQNVPTEFGPVSLAASYNDDDRLLAIRWTSPTRLPPKSVILHIPAFVHIEKVMVNGEAVDHTKEVITLGE